MRSRLLALAASTVLLTSLAACSGSDDDSASAPDASSSPSGSASAPAKDGTCTYKPVSEEGTKVDLPPSEPVALDSATIKTNLGDIKVTLKPDTAPCAVNSFASLIKQGYYDDTQCHRLVPGFVLQCGDPTGTGRGGPGYTFDDELSGSEQYPAGTLAMANKGPGTNTNGSQFFITLDEATDNLGPSYTVLGSVDADGLALAKKVEAAGNGPDGVAPAEKVTIESIS